MLFQITFPTLLNGFETLEHLQNLVQERTYMCTHALTERSNTEVSLTDACGCLASNAVTVLALLAIGLRGDVGSCCVPGLCGTRPDMT